MTTRKTLAEQLTDLVDDLVDTSSVRIVRDRHHLDPDYRTDKRATRTTYRLPSLLVQLAGEIAPQGNIAGPSKPGSRTLISIAARQLLTTINDRTVELVRDLEVGWTTKTHEALFATDNTGHRHPRPITDVLRHAIQLINTQHDPALSAEWVTRLSMWKSHAIQTLNIDRQPVRQIRGVRCLECGADTATTNNPDGDRVRQAAITVEWNLPLEAWSSSHTEYTGQHAGRRVVRAITCGACGSRWHRNGELEALADYYLLRLCDCEPPYAPCPLNETQAQRDEREMRHAQIPNETNRLTG